MPSNIRHNIAVVGSTGLVGRKIIQLLESRAFPIKQLFCVASQKSAGQSIRFKEQDIIVQSLDSFDFNDIQFVFFSAGSEISKHYAPIAAAKGAIVIDNTSCFRYDDDIPLIIPEVNLAALSQYKQQNIIANPNCSTIQMLVALKPIHDAVTLTRIEVATYQAVSGAGKKAIDELSAQSRQILDKESIKPIHFTTQIAFNAIPQIDLLQSNGSSREEMKMIWETHKILANKNLIVNPTCVRVPVFFGHAEAIHIETAQPIQASEVVNLLKKAPGVTLIDDPKKNPFPTQAMDAVGNASVLVGRIRNAITHSGINLWVVADNLNKGAALNAVQIAENLI